MRCVAVVAGDGSGYDCAWQFDGSAVVCGDVSRVADWALQGGCIVHCCGVVMRLCRWGYAGGVKIMWGYGAWSMQDDRIR